MRLEAGSKLGPYEIIGPIGAGGMGEVFRARDSRLGREVAIKILPHELSKDPQRLARFEREARSASALNHPNIITVHDFTSKDGEAWLVMELIRGDSLRHTITRGPLPMKRLLGIAVGVAEGLAAAHAAGIVHRDLKPENVMLTADGSPKILDFGLVKHAMPSTSDSPTEQRMSQSGAVMGTAAYMSPEQARGQDVDFRSDQFSFGLIVSEMATGKHPFDRPTGVEVLAAILTDDPEPLGERFPEPFVWIVDRCLAKNPAERYGSTADLAHDLERLRDGSDRLSTLRTRPAIPRRPSWLIPAALAVFALSLLLAVVSWRGRRAVVPAPPIHASISTSEFVDVSLDEVALPVALSPDGRYLVVYGADAEGNSNLSLHDLRSGETRVLAENTFSASWSTDSKAIVYISEGKLKTQAVDGSPPRTICDARPEGTPAWHGDTILFGQYSLKERGIYSVSARGGTPRLILGQEQGNGGLAWWPLFLPDGKRFLYLSFLLSPENGELRHELRVASLDGSPTQKVAEMDSRVEFANGRLFFARDGMLLAQPFDPGSARLSGEARPIVAGLHYFGNTGNSAFSVSQNGLLAWRSARRPVRLVWLDRSGLEVGAAGTGLFTPGGRLSPEGNRYAVGVVDPRHGSSDLWVFDLARESSERRTFRLDVDEKAPVWTPDGRTIYYRGEGSLGPPDIWKLLGGGDARQMVYRGPGVEEPQDVSPDGKWLLFVDLFSTGSKVHVLPLDPPGPPRLLTGTPVNELSPRFSPDGKRVAYSSDMSGRPEVYVRPFEGSGALMRISRDGETRPRWRKDGKELFFLGREARLMTVPIHADGTAGTPRILFQATGTIDYEPVADGSRFLVQIEERSREAVVHLLINWPARLAP